MFEGWRPFGGGRQNRAGGSSQYNPRGLPRPRDGRGGGVGMPGGRRLGRNRGPCRFGGVGYGRGGGRGLGRGRQS